MSEIADPENPSTHNPFSSPGGPVRETPRLGNEPSLTMLGVCIAVAMVPSFLTSYWLYFDADSSLPRKLLGVFPDLLFGVASGMGLALLVHALANKRFDTLAPGHWRLIVSLGMYGVYLHQSVPDVLALIFYILVLWRTSESKIWKGYALSSVIGFACSSSLLWITLMSAGNFEQLVDNLNEGALSRAISPAVLVILGMAVLQNIIDAVTLGLMIAGVIIDQQNGIKRDYYHYTGLVLMLFMPLILWAFRFAIFQVA